MPKEKDVNVAIFELVVVSFVQIQTNTIYGITKQLREKYSNLFVFYMKLTWKQGCLHNMHIYLYMYRQVCFLIPELNSKQSIETINRFVFQLFLFLTFYMKESTVA